MRRREPTSAVVTGASSGIGKAVASALAREGATVWAVGRDNARLDALRAEAAGRGDGKVVPLVADLTVDDQLRSVVDRVTAEGVDALVHSAGVLRHGGLASLPVEALDQQYLVNVRVPFQLTQLLLPALRERQGSVVFVNSSAGVRAGANNGSYAATKHALRALADSLRAEENRYRVMVVSIYPGRTATPMQEAVHAWEGRQMQPERLLQPEDVAACVVDILTAPTTAEITDVHLRPMAAPSDPTAPTVPGGPPP